MMALRDWLADRLVRAATTRLRRRHPDWAAAMIGEHASLAGDPDQLGWAFGALRASFAVQDFVYPAALATAVASMALYQWSADESLVTLAILAGLSLLLGVVRPSRFFVSGVVLGVVVAAVNAFETASGVRPAYEVHQHSWAHDLRWLGLIGPALASSALGRRLMSKRLA